MILENCGGLLLLALGAIAVTIETPEANSKLKLANRTEPENRDPKFFFISKLTGLWQVIEDEKGQFKPERRSSNAEKAIAMDYHYKKNLLFWSTYDGEIYSCPMRGRYVKKEDVRLLYKYDDWYPVAMAVDYMSDLLYIIDSKANTLHLMSLDCSTGTNLIRSFDPVVADGFEPRYLEVDPYMGELFLMDHYNQINHIYRMNLDGSGYRRIDPDNFKPQWRMGSFSLDRINKRILVSSPYDRAIVSLNYTGSDMRVVTRVRNYASSLTFDIKDNQSYLYFVNITAYAKNSLQEKVTDIMVTNVYRCNYTDLKCAPNSTIQMNDPEWSAVLQLKAVNPNLQKLPEETANPCTRAPCGHMCIFAAERKELFSCRCKSGYRLAADGRGCEKIDEFLIFENDNYVGGIDVAAPEPGLDRSNNEVFTPFKIKIRATADDQFGFDYDSILGRLIYSNVHEVVVKFLNKDTKYTTLIDPVKNYGLLSIDSTSNKFYFVEIKQDSFQRPVYSIGVSSILEPWKEAYPRRTFQKILRRGVGRVRSLAVYPPLGYVFYVSFNAKSDEFRLTRMMVDGSNATSLYEELGKVSYMTLDYEEGKIYYIDGTRNVCRADFDGKNVEKLTPLPIERSSPLGCINGFSVYGDWIYVKDSNDIRRYNKKILSGQWQRYDPKPFNFNMRTQLRLHSRKTNATITTPCSDKNFYGCMQLCFALPDAQGKLQPQCACDDDYKLNPDGKTCDL